MELDITTNPQTQLSVDDSSTTGNSESSESFYGHMARWVCHDPWKRDSSGMYHAGRHFCRAIHPFADIREILETGLKPVKYNQTGDIVYTPAELHRMKLLLDLLKVAPELKEKLLKAGPGEQSLFMIANLLDEGLGSIKLQDYGNLKGRVVEWIPSPEELPLSPRLSRATKEDRGFNHEATGRLLCPVGLDWNDTLTKKLLQKTDGNIIGDPWPIFLYKNYAYNSADPWDGLLQSAILLEAYKEIFIKGACACGEHEVTLSSIIYAATQLHFALSTAPNLQNLRAGEAKFEVLYNSLLEFFEAPGVEEKAAGIIDFWKQAFGEMYEEDANNADLYGMRGGSVFRTGRPEHTTRRKTLIEHFA